jgi:hypothetical protein
MNNLNNFLSINKLKEIYLISNTAPFLYNNFKEDESLINLSRNYEVNEIFNEFLKIFQTEIIDIDKLVLAYSLFIAILMKNNDEYFNKLKDLNISFEWFNELLSIHKSKEKSTIYFNIEKSFDSDISQKYVPTNFGNKAIFSKQKFSY